MKNKIVIILVLLSNVVFGQKGFNLNFGSGILTIKDNSGFNFDVGATYDISNKVGIYTNYNYSELNLKNFDENSNFNRFQFGGYYKLLNNSTQISSLVGFSVISANDVVLFDRKTTIGTDLGLLLLFEADKKFNYGIKWINSFTPSSIGGIMQANICFNYRL